MVFLWLAGRRRPPVLRTQERHRRVVGQEGQPAKHDPPHREAGRAGGAGEHLVLTRKDFMGNHEWCFYGWREGAAHQFYGPKNATDVWSIKKVNPQAMVHLTEKPVELATRALQYSTRPSECVLDLFGGSGTTLITAEQTGRRTFLLEIDPPYCDVIRKRWEKFTGKQAQRVGNG